MKVFISESRWLDEYTKEAGFEISLFERADHKGLILNLFLVRGDSSGKPFLTWLPVRIRDDDS